MDAQLTGGRLVSSSTKCSSSNHLSAVKTRMKSTTPFSPTSPSTPSTCLATLYQFSRSCLPVNLRCVWDLGLLMHRRSCLTPSSGTSTGMISTTREYSRHSFRKLRAQRTQATSIPSSQVLRLCLHLYSLFFRKPCKKNSVVSPTLPILFNRTPLPDTPSLWFLGKGSPHLLLCIGMLSNEPGVECASRGGGKLTSVVL
jgi:hypothetical protein